MRKHAFDGQNTVLIYNTFIGGVFFLAVTKLGKLKRQNANSNKQENRLFSNLILLSGMKAFDVI